MKNIWLLLVVMAVLTSKNVKAQAVIGPLEIVETLHKQLINNTYKDIWARFAFKGFLPIVKEVANTMSYEGNIFSNYVGATYSFNHDTLSFVICHVFYSRYLTYVDDKKHVHDVLTRLGYYKKDKELNLKGGRKGIGYEHSKWKFEAVVVENSVRYGLEIIMGQPVSKKYQKINNEERKRLKEEKRLKELEQERLIKQEKEWIENILSGKDIVNHSKKAVEEHMFTKLLTEVNKMEVKDREPVRKSFSGGVDVSLCVDSSKITVLKIGNDVINNYHHFRLNNTEKFVIDNMTCQKIMGLVYVDLTVHVQTDTIEKGIVGLKNGRKGVKFYNTVPEGVKASCKQKVKERREYFMEYVIHGNDVSITERKDLSRETKDYFRGRSTTGSRILTGSLVALLFGVYLIF